MRIFRRRAGGFSIVALCAAALGVSRPVQFAGSSVADHAGVAHFAAPHVILVYGTALRDTVVFSDWLENQQLLGHPVPGFPPDLSRRTFVRMALFSGPQWAGIREDTAALARLRPQQANQYARLYSARGNQAAVVVFESMPPVSDDQAPPVGMGQARGLSPAALQIFARRGVPTSGEGSH